MIFFFHFPGIDQPLPMLLELNPVLPMDLSDCETCAKVKCFVSNDQLIADVEGLDYAMREYMCFVDYVKACVERLNLQDVTHMNNNTLRVNLHQDAVEVTRRNKGTRTRLQELL